jgi:hypothetical protein
MALRGLHCSTKAWALTPFVHPFPFLTIPGAKMNPSQCTQPQELFGASMHAGGWPKLGWTTQDVSDDAMGLDDEQDGTAEH